ncbi:uncharacterized protein LOC119185246 isoform X2 [Rhipicephalus microplus]|uniref:uncharacterized protein LOC119185246 isoform X2 n=1 Tax=Rhipicephalus microplus TaxID=6941 RepID=UPI003F6C0C78
MAESSENPDTATSSPTESQVAELSRLLKEKNQQLYIIQEESLAQQSTITCLSEKISSLEKQKQAVDEQLLAYEEMVANLEEEMLKSQKCEEELQKSKVRLESEVKAGQLREEDLKESYATVSQKFLILEENFRKSRDRHRSNIRILQSDMDSLRRELNSARKELESSKEQFEKYKVRAHSVLKQQKQNAAGANTSETSDVESESVIENMKRQIDYLEKQLQMERDATKTARDDCEVMAQKHQHVLLEQKKEWRNRLDEIKQNAKDMAKELRKQLDLQHEKLSAEYQKKLEEKDAEYGQTIEKLKNELGEVHKMSAQAPTAPLQEMAAAGGDFSTLERQAGEVRAHSVLKEQKQNAAGANASETSDVESESVIENMKRQIDYLEKQLQMERDATKTARDDCEVMAQKHQHVLLEQKKEWRNRLDEVKQNAKDMAKELRKQLELQHEKLSAEYQKKLEEKDAEYGQTIEKLKNELGEVQKMSAQAPTAPLQEMAAAGGDFSTLERQAGEVRAHSVLKQQKQNAAGANTSETSDVESESVLENMKRQIDYLEKQLQMERDATKTARDDCEVMAQKHQHVLLEQKKEWRNRLDEVKQNAKDMAKELRKQLDLQHEKLSAEYQKKLEEKDAEYGQTIEKLKNELGEVHKMSAQAPTAPLQEMAAAGGDFSTLERQAGEVRAHSVLKEQKQNAAGANASETSDVESESVIENMKRQIDYLEKQLQMERDATKTARDDCEVMAQKHQHVLLEQKKEWRNRLDEVKQNAKDMAKELRKQMDLQHEKLSAEYQKKLEEKDAEYGQTIEKLKNELGEVHKMSAQAPTAPLQEMAAAGGDFSTLERQAGEGSESVTLPQQPLRQLPWELVPATGATPLETLLESTASVEERSQKTVSHLAEASRHGRLLDTTDDMPVRRSTRTRRPPDRYDPSGNKTQTK